MEDNQGNIGGPPPQDQGGGAVPAQPPQPPATPPAQQQYQQPAQPQPPQPPGQHQAPVPPPPQQYRQPPAQQPYQQPPQYPQQPAGGYQPQYQQQPAQYVQPVQGAQGRYQAGQYPPQAGYPPQPGAYQQPPGGYPPQPPGQGPYYPQQGAGGVPPKRRMSGKGWAVVALCVLLGIGVLIGVGFVIDRTLFSEKGGTEFSLQASPVYNEALSDIERYYSKPYSKAKITSAAEKAVKEAQEKGEESSAKLLDIGLTALGKALDDEHSGYMTPEQNKRLSEDLSGSFYGVGFTLKVDKDKDGKGTNRPKVVSVIKGSPSDKAGVKKDDIIMSVDGKDTKGIPLDTVILWIRGKDGTKVDIKARRGTQDLDFNMTREKITIPDVETEIVDGKYGVIRLFEFNKGVGQKVRDAVRDMKSKGVQGYILDLRNDPGGLLDEAVQVASVFINEGVVVSYQTKGSQKVDENARGGAETDQPLVVLVNGGSASSSEITAGALKDYDRATLVGTKTYGKGSVQKVYELDNRGAMKLTISLYYLPDGESIDGKGIEPDVKVEAEDDPNEEQIQFDKAKEVLQNLIDGRPPSGEVSLKAA